jgi:para-aminobenzoate synthetase/4-amino-4-deoxychorismate lyase
MGLNLNRFVEDPHATGVLLKFTSLSKSPQPGWLFSQPERECVCQTPEDIKPFFKHIEAALRAGKYLAGYMTYEFGVALAGLPMKQTPPHPRTEAGAWGRSTPTKIGRNSGRYVRVRETCGFPESSAGPLAWFGVFSRPLRVPWKVKLPQAFPGPAYWLRPCLPVIPYSAYQKSFQHIKQKISAGETYQVNYTFPLQTRLDGDEVSLFYDLFAQQPAKYTAWVRGGGRTVMSFSPELFFSCQDGQVITRPMKGTLARLQPGPTHANSKAALRNSEKDRAENIMIVDLLRNDLGRLCRTGSVKTSRLFQVESLPTVYQMTSTVEGRLAPGLGWETFFRSLFPCGSVTGAPKIQTMKIINQTEKMPRGVYTGAIGYLAPNGRAMFNLPIRTLELDAQSHRARMGVGSGVVADSQAQAEWDECLLKGTFLTQSGITAEYQLLETILWEPENGFRHLDLHLARIVQSAQYFGIACLKPKLLAALWQHLAQQPEASARRIRLLLTTNGSTQVESTVWKPIATGSVLPVVAWAKQRTHSRNIFLYHKTTNRVGYDQAWAQAHARGLMDVLFCNERKAVTEGAITNVVIRRGKVLLTPPVKDGLLPGVERAFLLKQGNPKIVERSLYRRDVLAADEIFLANSVRGLFPVRLEY